MAPRKRNTQRRRAPARRAPLQTYRYRGITAGPGTLTDTADGTAGRITNITDIIEQTISAPDVELNRALIRGIRGQYTFLPSSTALLVYSYGFIIAPFSLDVADIDPGVVGVQGFNWWTVRDRNIIPNTITSDDATPEFRSIRGSYKVNGPRRMRGFGESLLLVERVQGADITSVHHILDVTVSLP